MTKIREKPENRWVGQAPTWIFYLGGGIYFFCTCFQQQGWGRLQLMITITVMITCHFNLSITIMITIIRHYNYRLRL